MKSLDEQDHYEILEIVPGVSQAEIERAYQLNRAAFADDSLALYSIFGETDAGQVRDRIDEAYRVLANPETRSSYDARLGVELRSAPDTTPAQRPVAFDESLLAESASAAATETPRPSLASAAELPTAIDVFENLDAALEEDEQDFDGAALRRARVRRGIEIDQIADVTKVSTTYLHCLEDERFEDLPASVYIRGFVTAYARAIGVDPQRAAQSYMPRVEEARSQRRSSSLLER